MVNVIVNVMVNVMVHTADHVMTIGKLVGRLGNDGYMLHTASMMVRTGLTWLILIARMAEIAGSAKTGRPILLIAVECPNYTNCNGNVPNS